MNLPFYLSLKEIWRNRGRFALIGGVVALITTLVLFIAGLTEGLGRGGREYIENLDADLLLFQENVDLSISTSRVTRRQVREVLRLPEVENAGPIAFSSVSIWEEGAVEFTNVSIFGVEPGKPGEPFVYDGRQLSTKGAKEVLIDRNVAEQEGYSVGDELIIKSSLGADEELHSVKVVGLVESQKYFIQPGLILPYDTWDSVRPRGLADSSNEVVFNVIGVKLKEGVQWQEFAGILENTLGDVEAVDLVTAYEASPGYAAQQSTLSTQSGFTLLIGVLVIGGFFQIQTLQKINQVGMLKAIGASNTVILWSAITQIVLLNCLGVLAGAAGTLLLAAGLPAGIPIIFDGDVVTQALILLLLIGPLGGFVSLRTLIKAEPLTALGLAS